MPNQQVSTDGMGGTLSLEYIEATPKDIKNLLIAHGQPPGDVEDVIRTLAFNSHFGAFHNGSGCFRNYTSLGGSAFKLWNFPSTKVRSEAAQVITLEQEGDLCQYVAIRAYGKGSSYPNDIKADSKMSTYERKFWQRLNLCINNIETLSLDKPVTPFRGFNALWEFADVEQTATEIIQEIKEEEA